MLQTLKTIKIAAAEKITKLQNYKITKLQNYKITKFFSSAFFLKNTFFKNLFLNLFSNSFLNCFLFKNFYFKNFFLKNSFLFLLFFFIFFSCKPKIKNKDNETKSYNATFYLIIDNRDGKKEQDKEQKKYSFSIEEGSKFSKEQLDKLQQEFLDKNSTGYTFDGWYGDKNFSGDKITAQNLAEISIDEAKNFYGKMTLKQYSVTFNTFGGSAIAPVKINHGAKITKPVNPTKTGLTFGNWYKENTFQNIFNFETETITADTTLYADFLTSNAPTDLSLSVTAINENKAIGSVIGAFTTTDVTVRDSFSYSLVAGAGDDDNGNFSIDGDKLKSAKIFDFETKNSYKIRIRTTDATGLNFDKNFTIAINNLVEISYSYIASDRFYENPNDGTIANLLFINVNGDSFVAAPTVIPGIAGVKRYDVNTHYTVANVPAGLTLELRRDVASPFIFFSGKATAHAKANSVNNVTITLLPAILRNTADLSDVPTKTKNDIKISFDSYVALIPNNPGDTFTEEPSGNTGGISGRFARKQSEDYDTGIAVNNFSQINFTQNLIAAPVKGTHFTVNGLPANLSFVFKKVGDKTIRFYLNGTAVNHANSDDTTFTVTIDKSIFATPPDSNDDIIGRTLTFKIDFR